MFKDLRLTVSRYPVSDYRYSETNLTYTALSNGERDRQEDEGILMLRNDYATAPPFADIQRRVATLIQGKILVGHRIWNFLSVSKISRLCRSRYIKFRGMTCSGSGHQTFRIGHQRLGVVQADAEEAEE